MSAVLSESLQGGRFSSSLIFVSIRGLPQSDFLTRISRISCSWFFSSSSLYLGPLKDYAVGVSVAAKAPCSGDDRTKPLSFLDAVGSGRTTSPFTAMVAPMSFQPASCRMVKKFSRMHPECQSQARPPAPWKWEPTCDPQPLWSLPALGSGSDLLRRRRRCA